MRYACVLILAALFLPGCKGGAGTTEGMGKELEKILTPEIAKGLDEAREATRKNPLSVKYVTPLLDSFDVIKDIRRAVVDKKFDEAPGLAVQGYVVTVNIYGKAKSIGMRWRGDAIAAAFGLNGLQTKTFLYKNTISYIAVYG